MVGGGVMAEGGDFEIHEQAPHRAFRDFFVQGGVAVILLIVLVQGIFRLGQWLGPLIPFSWEKQVSALALKDFPLSDRGPEARARREVLQRLTDDLVATRKLPPDMSITIHYAKIDQVNAFATLGGNIVVFEGLIQRLPSENSLSMVIGHEMSHVIHRDALRSISGEQLVTLIVSLATGDSALAAQIVSNIELLTSLQFSREVEERSDLEGLAALNGHYGHVNGYTQTFDAIEDWIHDNGGDGAQPPEFLRDHPDTATRKLKLAAYAEKNHWKTDGPLTPLRQANFLQKQKFGPWGAPEETGPRTKDVPKDGRDSTNYQKGAGPETAPSAPATSLGPDVPTRVEPAPIADPNALGAKPAPKDEPAATPEDEGKLPGMVIQRTKTPVRPRPAPRG